MTAAAASAAADSRLWISGSGRSGTTWLSSLVAARRRTVLVFEPLHPRRVALPPLDPPLVEVYHRPYLRPDADAPDWLALVERLFRGDLQNRWTRYSVRPRRTWPGLWLRHLGSPTRVVKEIRGNLLCGWLSRRANARVVHVVRHPCATLTSQRRAGWGGELDSFLCNEQLVEDHLSDSVDYLRSLTDEDERRAARWAIENVVPLRQAELNDILVVRYEDAVRAPWDVLERIFAHAGWTLDDADRRRIEPLLGVGFATGGAPAPEPGAERWRSRISADDERRIMRVVDRVGVPGLYPAA